MADRRQLRPRQRRQQAVLRDKNYLKCLARAALQVAHEAQLLEQVVAQVLGLVHEQDGAAVVLGAVFQQKVGQAQPQHLFAAVLIRQRVIEEDRL